MTRWSLGGALLATAVLVHAGCSAALSAGGAGDKQNPGAGANDSAAPSSDAGATNGPNRANASKGLVVVHASPNLGAFRLCFGSDVLSEGPAGDLLPLPDRDLMPQSNVVGVEVGSAVRMKPLADIGLSAPLHAYAILEKKLRSRPANAPCSALVCAPGDTGGDCLVRGTDYFDLSVMPQELFSTGVQLLAISGCVPGNGGDVATCGADFDAVRGNARLTAISLTAFDSDKSTLPVQFAQLSQSIAGGTLKVSFGELGGLGLGNDVDAKFGSVSPSLPDKYKLDREDSKVYATHGFRVDTGGVTVEQSLASIQALSAPQSLPAEFYSAPSSFVFLVLGNAADTPGDGGVLADGGAADPGKALHLLGVPVALPEPDAGPLDAGAYDGSRPNDAGGAGD